MAMPRDSPLRRSSPPRRPSPSLNYSSLSRDSPIRRGSPSVGYGRNNSPSVRHHSSHATHTSPHYHTSHTTREGSPYRNGPSLSRRAPTEAWSSNVDKDKYSGIHAYSSTNSYLSKRDRELKQDSPYQRDHSGSPRRHTSHLGLSDTSPLRHHTPTHSPTHSPLHHTSHHDVGVGRSDWRRDSPQRTSWSSSPSRHTPTSTTSHSRPTTSSLSANTSATSRPNTAQASQGGPSFNGESIVTQASRDQASHLPAFLSAPKEFLPPEPDPRTFTPLLPPKDRVFGQKNTLVLDLDETLVHSAFKPITLVDMLIDIKLDGQMHTVYVRKRPYVEEFLARMCELYEVVILTASLEVYADPVLDQLDSEGYWIHHRLFRDSCANLNGNYIKDLSYLGRPLHQVIIVDNTPAAYLFQPRNAIPISSWFDDNSDTELRDMIPVLERAAKTDNVYPVLDAYRQAKANGEHYYP
eukprot:TRINITY_DN32752_c0_g1_i1.p1 TRINITY_DN32752_c0_g1~~TRINITY_DN32752_c0_g1_i1.p1  ORF type:complete len:465 (-),score=13.01 TRINITY_DN32752_c0_g1_i1:605-1999(-)